MNSKYVSVSVVLHFFAVLLISSKVVNKSSEFKYEKIEVQLAEAPEQQQPKIEPSKKVKSKLASRPTKQKRSAEQVLFPTMKDMYEKKLAYDSLPELTKESSIDESLLPPVLTQYRGMSGQDVRFATSLWTQIDQSIVESPYLSEYGHVGQVAFTFEISSEGKIVESRFRAKAADPILKVVAARAIRTAIQNENNELVFPKKAVRFQANFTWASLAKCKELRGIHQSTLNFCKLGADQRKSFTASEKAATYLGALRYGPGMIDEIKKYKRQEDHKNINFDPFESFRRDRDFDLGG